MHIDGPNIQRTTEFVFDAVDSAPDCPVLWVKLTNGFLSLAKLDDIERLKREVRRAALEEIREFVVAHTYDTTIGGKIDDFISGEPGHDLRW